MSTPLSPDTARGYFVAAASAFLLAFTGILIKYIGVHFLLPPLTLAFWRNLTVCACLLPILLLRGTPLDSPLRQHGRFLCLYGVVLALFNAMWTTAVLLNGAAVATVMVYCSAAYTAVLGRLLYREACPPSKWLAILLCLAGCTLVSGALQRPDGEAGAMGMCTGLASGVLYAAYSLMGRSAGMRGLNPWVTLLYTFLAAACCLGTLHPVCTQFAPEAGLAAPLSAMLPGSLGPDGWGFWVLLLAIGPTMLGFGLFNVSLCYLPSSVVNIILTLEPALTAVIAYWALGERMTPPQWAGSGMILCGVIVLRIAGYRRKRPGMLRETAILAQKQRLTT